MKRVICFAAALLLFGAGAASAQFDLKPAEPEKGPQLDEAKTQRWKVGVTIQAAGGPCAGLFATIPVPADWPEQQVRVVDEEKTEHVTRVRERILDGGVKQKLIYVQLIQAGQTASWHETYEVTKNVILPPTDTDRFVIPKRVPAALRKYLGSSPYIETRHSEIRALPRKIVSETDTAWKQVESIYDWVRANVKYKNGKLKGALAALRDGDGDCEELTSLFIAICRAHDVPARTVWVPKHCYPEFYLEDENGEGHWFPCQAAGTRAFGEMPDTRPILQKGDNFRVPEKKQPQRYVAEFLKGRPVPGGGRPQVNFRRELLGN